MKLAFVNKVYETTLIKGLGYFLLKTFLFIL